MLVVLNIWFYKQPFDVVGVDWDSFYAVDTALNGSGGVVVLVLLFDIVFNVVFVVVIVVEDGFIGNVTMLSVNFYDYVTEFVIGFILFMLVLIVLIRLVLVVLTVLFKF